MVANDQQHLKQQAAELKRVMQVFSARMNLLSGQRTQLYREYTAALERKKIQNLRAALGKTHD